MHKQIKTRVSHSSFSTTWVDITVKGIKYIVAVYNSNATAPRVWLDDGTDKLSTGMLVRKSDPRYVAAVRIALSAVYRVDLTV